MSTAKPSTEIAVKSSPIFGLAAKYHVEPEKFIGILRGTILKPSRDGKPATTEEVAAFCVVAEQYNLNPFTREIHAFVGRGGGIVPIVGIDGWVKIVNSHASFDGCRFDTESDEHGNPVSVTCTMHVKGRQHPVIVTEYFGECNRPTEPWKTMPWRMLRHKAYMQAARYAFGLSGIFDDDEANDVMVNTAATDRPPVRMPRAVGEVEPDTPVNQDADEPVSEASDPALVAGI